MSKTLSPEIAPIKMSEHGSDDLDPQTQTQLYISNSPTPVEVNPIESNTPSAPAATSSKVRLQFSNYEGETCPVSWVQEVNLIVKLYRDGGTTLNDKQVISTLLPLISNSVIRSNIIDDLSATNEYTLEKFTEIFLKQFSSLGYCGDPRNLGVLPAYPRTSHYFVMTWAMCRAFMLLHFHPREVA